VDRGGGVRRCRHPDEGWAEVNLASGTETYETEVVWIFKPDGTLFYARDEDTLPEKTAAAQAVTGF
jgi:hypothetical protein